jgi:selenophosphate synthase
MKKLMVIFALLSTVGLSAKTIATVNGYSIDEKEANAFLKVATKGKVTYRRLRKKDKISLVERLAVDKLVLKTALKEIKKKEQENIIAGFWLRKKQRSIRSMTKRSKMHIKRIRNTSKIKKARSSLLRKSKR